MALTPESTVFDLIRHGEPEGGPLFRGHRDDPLSDLGWQQMQGAVGADEQWDLVLSSPLSRCHAFAKAIAHARQIPLHTDPALREIYFGDWEGLTPEQIEERQPGKLSAFWNNAQDNPPPEGETLAEFHHRVSGAWAHWQEALQGQRVLLVCHGGVIRMVLSSVLGMTPAAAMAGVQVPYACRSRVRVDHSEHGVLSCLVQHGRLE